MKDITYICYPKKKYKETFESNLQTNLYGSTNYSGTAFNYGVGKYDLRGKGGGDNPAGIVDTNGNIGNDSLQSVKIPSGLKIILIRNDINDTVGGGNQMTITLINDTPDLSKLYYENDTSKGQWNNTVSSFIVALHTPNSVLLYPKIGYTGWGYSYTPGNYDINANTLRSSNDNLGGIGNKSLNSIQIPSGMMVVLYQNGGFTGFNIALTGNIIDLSKVIDPINTGFNWANNMSSFIYSTVPPLPSRPSSLMFSNVTLNQFTVKWSGGANAQYYTYVIAGARAIPANDNGISANTATFTGLIPGSSITITINATNISGTSSETGNIILPPNPPTAISNSSIKFTNISSTGFTISWLGGIGASTSYTYFLDGKQYQPSTDNGASGTAIFNGLKGGSTIPVMITASNTSGNSSGNATVVLKPSQLSNPTFPSVTSSSFTVTWSGGDGATSYNYKLDNLSPSAATFTNNGVLGKSATFNSLTAGKSYSFSIEAVNSSGSSGPLVGSVMLAPSNINTFITSAISSTGFTIKWSGGTGATSYNYTIGGSPVNVVSDLGVSNQTAIFDNLIPGDKCQVGIIARNINGSTTGNTTVLLKPAIISTPTYSNQTSTSITVSWNGGKGATSYSYQIKGASPRIGTFIDNGVSGNTATFNELSGGLSYPIIITASNSSGNVSLESSFTLPPSILNNFTFSNVSSIGFTINWEGGFGATSYIYNINGNIIKASLDKGVTNKTATFSDLVGGQVITVIVYAKNNFGSTPGTASVLLKPSIISNFIFSKVTPTSFTLSWTGGNGATSYTYRLNSVVTIPKVDNSLTNQSISFVDLIPGMIYRLDISAVNSSGITTSSSFITAPLVALQESISSPTVAPPTTFPPSINIITPMPTSTPVLIPSIDPTFSPNMISGTSIITSQSESNSNTMLYITITTGVIISGIGAYVMLNGIEFSELFYND
jgi:hypothetical protein